MKQHLRFLFMLLLAIVYGGAMFGQTFKKVTSETELKAGDIIAIVNEANNVALSTNQKTNNRGQTSISISNGSFESTKNVQEITLEGKTGAWYFNVGNGYLYAAGSSKSNYLKTEPTKDSGGNSKASITFAKGQVTIKFLGKNTNNLMAYNKNSSLFAVYSTNNDQLPIQIYKKQVASGTKTTISFPKSSYTLNYAEGENGTYTISDNKAVLTPAEAGNVTYSVSSTVEGLAVEVEGEVMVDTKKVGTATVTASFAGNDTYAASSASYTITVQDNRTIPTLTFANKSYTFNVGDKVEDFTNALTIDPAEAGTTGITYSSDKEWALVDENSGLIVVSTDAAGTATITASYAENDKYNSAKASYTIEVKKAAVVEDGVFDFTQSVNDYGSGVKASNGSSFVDKSTWVAGNVTMTTSKGTGSGVRWWLNNDKTTELRVYKGSDFTISVGEGYFINSIKFDGVNTGLTARPGTMNNGTWSGKSQSVTFTASNARKDINSITVKYAKLETLTTAASGFATYAAGYDVNYSALGLTTYAITLDEANNKVSYNRFEGVVPAGKAVLVQGTASTPYELTPAEEAADAKFTTDLKASDGTVTAADDKIYAFGTLNGKSGFKLVNNGVVIPAKKGYLQLTGTTAAKPTFFAFDGIGTGISHIEADAALENAAMYNLAGQRVDKSYKGVVIVNGKKMLRK